MGFKVVAVTHPPRRGVSGIRTGHDPSRSALASVAWPRWCVSASPLQSHPPRPPEASRARAVSSPCRPPAAPRGAWCNEHFRCSAVPSSPETSPGSKHYGESKLHLSSLKIFDMNFIRNLAEKIDPEPMIRGERRENEEPQARLCAETYLNFAVCPGPVHWLPSLPPALASGRAGLPSPPPGRPRGDGACG